MQKNEFEKQVQHQLEDFSLTPANAVWQKVEAELVKDKQRRRVLFFWLLAGILLLGGTAGFWIANTSKETAVSSTPTNNSNIISKNEESESISDKIKEKEAIDANTSGNTPSKENIQTQQESNPENQINSKTKDAQTTTGNESLKKSRRRNRSLQSTTDNMVKRLRTNGNSEVVKTNASPIKTDERLALKEKSTSKEGTKATEETKVENAQPAKVDSTIELKLTPTISNEESRASSIKKGAKTKKPWLFGATLIAGISDNVSGSFFDATKSKSRSVQNAGPVGTTSGSNPLQASFSDAPRYNYKGSYSWGAGAFIMKDISKKAAISIGLNYQLNTANIIVGTRADSISNFQDSMLMKVATVASFYRAGGSEEFKNKYHLLQVPINMRFRLNRNAGKPVTLSTGLTGGILLGSNALYLNYRSRTYYKETEQFKRLMLSTQTGLTFTLFNRKTHQLQAGPQVQYQLSNLTKPTVKSNEHLWFLGVKTNLLFKTLNK